MKDQVPPFPSETAVSIVEEELGGPVNAIFDHFDYEPIAAASLGNSYISPELNVIYSSIAQFVNVRLEGKICFNTLQVKFIVRN